jgi:hypothetical protein
VKSSYTAYATLANGASVSTPFTCALRAVAHAKQVHSDAGACFVVRNGADSEVIFNTHGSLLDVLTHAGRSVKPKATENTLP